MASWVSVVLNTIKKELYAIMVSEFDIALGSDSFIPTSHKNTPSAGENEARSALSGEKARHAT
jgi:hypothetical protein